MFVNRLVVAGMFAFITAGGLFGCEQGGGAAPSDEGVGEVHVPKPPAATEADPEVATEAVYDKSLSATYEKDYEFTEDWFSPYLPLWEQTFGAYKGQPDLRYLEVGLFEGRSFLWMLENVLTHPTSSAVGLEPFIADIPQLSHNIELSDDRDRMEILTEYSQIALPKLEPKSFDFIYIDGDHDAAGVLVDAVLCWPLLKEGGIMILDDYKWADGKIMDLELPLYRRPEASIDAFLIAFHEFLELVHLRFQCVIRKTDYLYWEEHASPPAAEAPASTEAP